MFEVEAEEYRATEKYVSRWDMEQTDLDCIVEETYRNGAEFGYNKANEWHYVKDILPEEDVYVYLLCKGDDFPVVARRHIFYGKTEWEWDCKWGSGFQLKADNEKIIAWKEIVLPKKIE